MNKKALFAAGCFWGVQHYFDQVPGVLKTVAGYTGGNTENPSYEDVCGHETGHAEAVLVEFDPELVYYETLLKHFFKIHNPTQRNRQGPDIGDQYRSAVFYFDEKQKVTAEKLIESLRNNFDNPIVTEITKAGTFYPAEDYHQKYAEKNGRGMCHVNFERL